MRIYVLSQVWTPAKVIDGVTVGHSKTYYRSKDAAAAEAAYEGSDAGEKHLWTQQASMSGTGRNRTLIPHPGTEQVIRTTAAR